MNFLHRCTRIFVIIGLIELTPPCLVFSEGVNLDNLIPSETLVRISNSGSVDDDQAEPSISCPWFVDRPGIAICSMSKVFIESSVSRLPPIQRELSFKTCIDPERVIIPRRVIEMCLRDGQAYGMVQTCVVW